MQYNGCMTILRKCDKTITVRVTEADSLAIHARAHGAGLSLSEYVRASALGQLVTVPATAAAPAGTTVVVKRRYLVSSSDGDDAA